MRGRKNFPELQDLDFSTSRYNNQNVFKDHALKTSLCSRQFSARWRKRIVFCFKIIIVFVVFVGFLYFLKHTKVECYSQYIGPTCHAEHKNPYRWYGTKTDYRHLIKSRDKKPEEFKPKDCTPLLFFLYNRHSIRYPSKKDIIKLRDALPKLQQNIVNSTKHICKKDLDNLNNWKYSYVPDDDNQVTSSGREASKEQAKRMKEIFKEILSIPYSKDYFTIGFTSRIRTRQTAEAFLEGLLSADDYKKVLSEFPEPTDALLQFHQECGRILQSKGGKEKKFPEVVEFKSGPYFEAMLKTIGKRLQIGISQDEISLMAKMCNFDNAITDKAPWCAIFTDEEMKIFEYLEDLDDYYGDAYGLARNYEQACPIIRELLNRIQNATSGRGPRVILYFSHAGGFKKVIARLGLFKDPHPLVASKYCAELNSRKWRSSLISPFNANIAFVVFRCPDGNKIAAFLNEELIVLPGCSKELCPLDTFVSMYKEIASNCDLNKICT